MDTPKRPQVPDAMRIATSTLTNKELAYLVDLFDFTLEYEALNKAPPGWTADTENNICSSFREAAKIRGINAGVVVVTQTIDLRS